MRAQVSEKFEFEDLEQLRNFLVATRLNHVSTMNHYASGDGKGFWHQPSKRNHASLSSTATCVSSLVHAGLWNNPNRKWGETKSVADRLLDPPWESAGLRRNNPFGLSFIAEGVLDLIQADPYQGHEEHLDIINTQIAPLLIKAITSGKEPFATYGSVGIKPYPPSTSAIGHPPYVLLPMPRQGDLRHLNHRQAARAW